MRIAARLLAVVLPWLVCVTISASIAYGLNAALVNDSSAVDAASVEAAVSGVTETCRSMTYIGSNTWIPDVASCGQLAGQP